MARVAVLDPDDDRHDAARFTVGGGAGDAARRLTGRRWKSAPGGDLVARLTPAGAPPPGAGLAASDDGQRRF